MPGRLASTASFCQAPRFLAPAPKNNNPLATRFPHRLPHAPWYRPAATRQDTSRPKPTMSWLYPFASSSSHRRRRSKDRHSTHHHSSRHSTRAPSIFSLGSYANRSTASSVHSSGSSSRRAKPRSGFIARIVHKIKRLFRHIVHYAKKHPMKVFFMVIMPLITGGVLQKLLGAVGIRVPKSLMGGSSRGGGSGGGGFDSGGIGESVQGLMSVAKMFL
ncbi:predicted protein [Uncinocarpus reesii 1704]|uniref:Uncharacterized protein n=1 Tax=Uncinocarpus reesii (strain UAMH 1704) TaxID=336963 RepID=C4JXQ7_UNCRE|nr:uncharacterized protein UREG_07845 [Uncinocarpus reesii 1704]EEP82980.1 predicted protein [Uncinocarpus reesii 1704]